MAQTKFLVRFLNRAARFDADVEFVDIVASAVKKGLLHDPKSSDIFKFVDKRKHPRIVKHKSSDHNRGLAVAHLKDTVHSAYIKDLYEDASEYVASLLGSAARKGLDPGRLIGEHRMSFEANELLALRDWDAVVQFISRSLFRKLESEQSTKKLLDALDKKLALKVDPTIVAAALPYLDIRHLLVHADGVADDTFIKAYPGFGLKAGDAFTLDWKLVHEARTTITALVHHYDERALSAGVVATPDIQPVPPIPPKSPYSDR